VFWSHIALIIILLCCFQTIPAPNDSVEQAAGAKIPNHHLSYKPTKKHNGCEYYIKNNNMHMSIIYKPQPEFHIWPEYFVFN
jgi:hypothetical protein